MIVTFFDKGTQDICNGKNTKQAGKKLPTDLWKIALRKFYFLDNAANLKDLKIPPANYLEMLQGDRKGQYSIRINQQYRICFDWTEEGPAQVEITDYH
ncbi:MAG: type II toxin-antitoxin system RelE/ParE family toxin [Desulfococcaceae bacterium]|jgi:proteic killer suppression protein|nr:type II toxin-antitoxin system RelE/ParE family toxin [Desulfococcaceae bacterium]